MAVRYVSVDHDTPMLLPPDLRDWVPADHIVHFVIDAVALLDLSSAKINHRGTGSAQYPPSMMLGLLIYSYATGTFSSRKIEKLTYENLAARFLSGDTHPDHDSICTFRRENKELMESAFHRILHCAALSQILKVGDITVAIDGTKILASASKHGAVSHGHALEQMKLLEDQIAELLAKAEDADSTPLQDGLSIPAEIARREERIGKLKQATAVIEARAAERCQEETQVYQQKTEARERKQRETGHKPRGRAPLPPKQEPSPKDQYNFTDPESRIMKAGGGFQQCYNAQAAVEVDSRLIVGGYVTDAPNDKRQLIPALRSISSEAGRVGTGLIDSGYYSTAALTEAETGGGPQILASTGRKKHGRSVAELELREDTPAPPEGAEMAEVMAWRTSTAAGKELYGLRKQTVEPVFGIIKEALGFRRFHLRGLSKVNLEWVLVRLAYNIKRLYHIDRAVKSRQQAVV
jgi:transposase